MALHGYYVSRVLATLAWLNKVKVVYILLATAAFVAHSSFMAADMWRDISPEAKADAVPFIIGGTCIVFACAFAGDKLRVHVG